MKTPKRVTRMAGVFRTGVPLPAGGTEYAHFVSEQAAHDHVERRGRELWGAAWPVPAHRREPNRTLAKNNTSGVTGVYKYGNYWIALWREDGKTVKEYYNANVLGERRAFRAACRARSKAIARLYGR